MNEVGVVSDLNDKQYEAVTYDSGSLLVLAGAGSGKTKVLTTRIYWLIKNKEIHPTQILAVTFTNKAAKEMQHRVYSLTKANVKQMWIGTFHSVAMRLLRLHYALVGLPSSFQVIDNSEQMGIIKLVLKILHLSDEDYPVKEIQSYINNNKDLGVRSNLAKPYGMKQEVYLSVYVAYEQMCNKSGLVDFNELLLRSYELLRDNPNILKLYQGQFKYILIDEFQDTNTLQYLWILLLKTSENSVFAVGDDDQSIYAFRGAKVSNLRTFLVDYKVTEPIRLEQNYRSTKYILEAANAVIENNSDRIGKKLWTDHSTDSLIKLYEGYTEEDEAYYVADEIVALNKKGYKYSEIAVLYRSNAQSRMFEQLLYSRKIPYRVYGGLRFFDRQEIRHVLAYLRLIVNPMDDEAFLRVVNVPPRGIGPKSIERLIDVARENKQSLMESYVLLEPKIKKNIELFVGAISQVTDIYKSCERSLSEIMEDVLEMSGLKAYYNNKKNEERLDNLNELISAIESFTAQDSSLSLNDFLVHAVLESGDAQAENAETAVQLMTIHASKGLEFKVIFVVGLEDGLFPHERSKTIQEDLEEERRLMYVAITRSKERLFLTRACSRLMWGKRMSAPISRFVNEIPNNIIDNVSGISDIGTNYMGEVASNSDANVKDRASRGISFGKTSHVHSEHNDADFKIGDIVNHGKFGRGKITSLVSDADKLSADIYFVIHGKKTLNLNIAKIEKID